MNSGLTTTDGHHIYLFSEAGGIIVGRVDGNNDGTIDSNAADVAAFAISINQLGQVSIAQYLSIHNDDNTNPNDTMILGDTVSAQLAVTDNDGDTVTQSVMIGFYIRFDDDGPKVSIHASQAHVVQDETPGVQNSADPNSQNDVSSADLSPEVLASFDAVANKGVDPDVAVTDHGAIGFATNASASLVNVVPTFGADGAALIDAQVLTLTIHGGDGANSGLKTTDGHAIRLFVENGLIVGRYDSDNSGTINNTGYANGTVADAAAFALAIDQSGHVSIAQYVLFSTRRLARATMSPRAV